MDKKIFKTNGPRLALLVMVCAGIATFFLLGGHHLLTFDQLVARKNTLIGLAETHPGLAQLLFVTAYLILGLFALPGSTLLNVTAGVLFDFWKGLFWVIVASTLASSLACFIRQIPEA
jgi:uncharacterized membrane protein YdjX (TVP38/TMEM64 family)